MKSFDEILNEIEKASFFSSMGVPDIQDENVILIEGVCKVFVHPSDIDFKGYYAGTEWLPTSPTQDDPFYKKINNPKDIVDLRIKINKAIMNSIKEVSKDNFICAPHDFSLAAKNGICFAFRQYVSEHYLGLGNRWEEIVNLYYSGHWPVGYAKEKIIAI